MRIHFLIPHSVVTMVLAIATLAAPARASKIEVIVTGTVFSGTDKTGVFGFPAGANLAGEPYTLTFTFDDTLGKEGFTSGSSYIENTATSNPGTALLQIGDGSFDFGTTEYSLVTTSSARKVAIGGSSYSLGANSGPYGGEWNDIQGTISPAAGTVLSTNPSWEASFADSNLNNGVYHYSLDFGILEESANLSASGYLAASSITVEGLPPASNAPEVGSLWLMASGFTLLAMMSLWRRKPQRH